MSAVISLALLARGEGGTDGGRRHLVLGTLRPDLLSLDMADNVLLLENISWDTRGIEIFQSGRFIML